MTPERGIAPDTASGRSDHPWPWSAPSKPRMLMWIPEAPPAAPRPLAADGSLTVTVTLPDPPLTHPKAVDGFRLAAWVAIDDGPLAAAAAVPPGSWPKIAGVVVTLSLDAADAAVPMSLKLAVVDRPAGWAHLRPCGSIRSTEKESESGCSC